MLSRHGANRTRWGRRHPARARSDRRRRPRQHHPGSRDRPRSGPLRVGCEAHRAGRDRRRRGRLPLRQDAARTRSSSWSSRSTASTLAALFFVVASGFTLIFGLMRVVNMAHGALYLFGGYIALEMQNKWFVEERGRRRLHARRRRRGGRRDDRPARLDHPAAPGDGHHRHHRRGHPAGLPALEPGPGPAPGADHDRALGDLRRPDARRLRRHLQGHQDAVGLADLDHAPGRGPVRLLPRRRRARRGPADRRRRSGTSSRRRASGRSCAPAWTTATWSPRSASTSS